MDIKTLIQLNPRIVKIYGDTTTIVSQDNGKQCWYYYDLSDMNSYTTIGDGDKLSCSYCDYQFLGNKIYCSNLERNMVGSYRYSCEYCVDQKIDECKCTIHEYLTSDRRVDICMNCHRIMCTLGDIKKATDKYSKLLCKSNLQYDIDRYDGYYKMVTMINTTNILGHVRHIHALMCVRDYIMSSSILGGNYDVYRIIVLLYLKC